MVGIGDGSEEGKDVGAKFSIGSTAWGGRVGASSTVAGADV